MANTTSKERFFDFGAQGKFGKAWEYGQKIYGFGHYGEKEIEMLLTGYGIQQFGFSQFGDENLRWGIYQKRHGNWVLIDGKKKYFGPIKYIRQNFYIPKEPGTGGQPATWDNFKNGVAAWKLLTSEQKQEYNERAKKLPLYGYNLFMKEWLKSH